MNDVRELVEDMEKQIRAARAAVAAALGGQMNLSKKVTQELDGAKADLDGALAMIGRARIDGIVPR